MDKDIGMLFESDVVKLLYGTARDKYGYDVGLIRKCTD